MTKFNNRMSYGDVSLVAQAIGIPTFSLWAMVPKFFDPFDRDNIPYTTDGLLLRKLCQNFPTNTVRKALGLAA